MRVSYLIMPLCLLMLWGCEDVVDVQYNVPSGIIYNVDAFINDGLDTQTISIVESPNFLDNSQPVPVADALVSVTDSNGNEIVFTHQGEGLYIWVPGAAGLALSAQVPTGLRIQIGTHAYTAESLAGDVPSIDSLTFIEDDFPFAEEGAVNADFWATDIAGQNNYYWAKMSLNGRYLDETYAQNKLALNGAYDESADNIQFIPPVRTFTLEDAVLGDMVHIELWGIDSLSYEFLGESFELLNNQGQFAVPYYNPRCNLIPETGSRAVIGWFGTGKIATLAREFDLE